MREVGRVRLTESQGKTLIESGNVTVLRSQLLVRGRALRAGDLIWVQEPYYEFGPYNKWTSQSVFGIAPGPRFGTPTPEHVRRAKHKATYHTDPTRMPRSCSRATLEVIDVSDERVVCLVRMIQIDKLLAALREAKGDGA